MKVDLQCSIQLLNDAIAQGSDNVVREVFAKCREIIKDGGIICMYEEFLPPVNVRQNRVIDDLEEFNLWAKTHFSSI